MNQPPVFPVLRGLGWPVKKTASWSTSGSTSVSGRDFFSSNWTDPIWLYELSIEAMSDDKLAFSGVGPNSYQALVNLFNQCKGKANPFLYIDPFDKTVVNNTIGTGDGATTLFQLTRLAGYGQEPVGWVISVDDVHIGGVKVTGWTYIAPSSIRMNIPPATGAQIMVSFTFAYMCRFTDDTLETSSTANHLWSASSVKFQSVRYV